MMGSGESLKKGLNAKLSLAAKKGVEEVRDHRAETSGNFRRPDFAEDKLILVEAAHAHVGNVSLAHRLLMSGWTNPKTQKRLHFSDEYRSYVAVDLRKNKSYLPAFMRLAVRPLLTSIVPYALGPGATKLARPSRFRDWGDVGVGDWVTSDDETGNSIVFWADLAGEYECKWGRFNVGRPQILPLYDVASEMPLALTVSPTKGYSGDTIRDLVIPAWRDPRIGLPFKGALFERGIWKSKHVEALTNWSKIDGAFSAQGLSLRIRHATTPKAKTIERVFGSEQNRTCTFPGYIGRGTKGENYERVHRFVQSLKRVDQPRKEMVDPREALWSLEQFTAELEKVMLDIAREPQNGERFRGQSPEEIGHTPSPILSREMFCRRLWNIFFAPRRRTQR